MEKLLILGDYLARTGFGTVSKNIIAEIKKSFPDVKITIVAINYFGEPIWENENTYVVSARRNDVNDDPYGRYFFLKFLQENDYDSVFICQDLGVIRPFIEVLEHIKREKKEQNRKSFKTIFYFPVDCRIIEELTTGLDFFDLLVTYTEFGRQEVLRNQPQLKGRVKVIPHGNNSKHYYPLAKEEKEAFRRHYFGENWEKFIITNVNRNQPRKDLPNTIFGFIEAKKIWPKDLPAPFLYLHTHPKDPMGWDLRAIFLQTDLEEDVDYKLIPADVEHSMADIETVNKIYNASDLFLTTTLGEGWGLTFSEAAACKIPIIAPYTTSFMEMSGYGKNAYMLEIINPVCNLNDNVIREQTDIYEIADMLVMVANKKITQNPELTKKIEDNYKWIKGLEWSEVCKMWADYFKKTF